MRSTPRQLPENFVKSDNSRNGICGLQNLGNTCFMNSGLQCLSNTRKLTKIFLSDEYKNDLNPTNSIGTGCKLVKSFALLMKEMWLGTQPVVSPWYFKRELGDFVPQFYGFQQQDSHELVTYTLDLIHEDLNRVKSKPVPEEIQSEGLTESQLAAKSWEVYLSRNQSHVVDLMHGQLRSQVTCPMCGNVSVTFDPFASISVSFTPKSNVKTYDAIFVPCDAERSAMRFRMDVQRGGHVRDLKITAERVLSVDANSLLFTKAFGFNCIEVMQDDVELATLTSRLSIIVLEVPRQSDAFPVMLEICRKPESRYASKSAVGYTRVMMVRQQASLMDVHRQVYAFLQGVKQRGEKETEPKREAELMEMYTRDQAEDSSSKFTLNLINLQREKLQFSTSHYSSSAYLNLKCDYCQRKDCMNCPLPSLSDTPFSDYFSMNKSDRPFRLEVILPASETVFLRCLSEVTEHTSVVAGQEEEQKLREQSYTLEQCLALSGRPEKLDAENEVYCGKCKTHVQADKQMQLYKLPEVLILHLKRFKQRGYIRDKDERLIRFPLTGLDMSPFLCHATREPQVYDLYAVSNHFGGLGGGHYTAYAKNAENGQWYGFNDSSVSRIDSDPGQTIVSPAAYVLFYERRLAH